MAHFSKNKCPYWVIAFVFCLNSCVRKINHYTQIIQTNIGDSFTKSQIDSIKNNIDNLISTANRESEIKYLTSVSSQINVLVGDDSSFVRSVDSTHIIRGTIISESLNKLIISRVSKLNKEKDSIDVALTMIKDSISILEMDSLSDPLINSDRRRKICGKINKMIRRYSVLSKTKSNWVGKECDYSEIEKKSVIKTTLVKPTNDENEFKITLSKALGTYIKSDFKQCGDFIVVEDISKCNLLGLYSFLENKKTSISDPEFVLWYKEVFFLNNSSLYDRGKNNPKFKDEKVIRDRIKKIGVYSYLRNDNKKRYYIPMNIAFWFHDANPPSGYLGNSLIYDPSLNEFQFQRNHFNP